MNVPRPRRRVLALASVIPRAFPNPQTPSFQCDRWKSLWKKSSDSSNSSTGTAGTRRRQRKSSARQVLYYQHYMRMLRISGASRPANQPSYSCSHLLHSCRATSRLRVTNGRICHLHKIRPAGLANHPAAARIVRLTRPIRRTILAEPTTGVAGERPRKLFRE